MICDCAAIFGQPSICSHANLQGQDRSGLDHLYGSQFIVVKYCKQYLEYLELVINIDIDLGLFLLPKPVLTILIPEGLKLPLHLTKN